MEILNRIKNAENIQKNPDDLELMDFIAKCSEKSKSLKINDEVQKKRKLRRS